jgi:hypothetical protein
MTIGSLEMMVLSFGRSLQGNGKDGCKYPPCGIAREMEQAVLHVIAEAMNCE